jgi:alpha-L-rhamnosidase
LARTQQAFWNESLKLFVNNQPWLGEDVQTSHCDRSIATAVLFDQCPESPAPCIKMLVDRPATMGLSYPPNAIWRYRALAKAGRMDVVLDEFRRIWSTQPSVVQNNTMSENFDPKPDWYSQWSHAAIAPLNVIYADIAGITPTSPGYATCTIRPQLDDLPSLELEFRTPRGTIHFTSTRSADGTQDVHVRVPPSIHMTTVATPGVRVTITPSPH